ncbi:MAG: GGDEF domain-containing protein [Rubrivivax sp.]|nr:GGDEF domain-containing protein [Rubrivivax sp.]
MALPARLTDLLLGREPRQRMRVSQTALALALYLAFAVVQHVEVLLGLVDEAASWRLTAFCLGGALGFFVLMRSGLNQRLPEAWDRSLTLPQTAWAMTALAWSYAITGPARGAIILIMLLPLIFGAFALDVRRARALAAAGFGLLAAVALFKAVTDPLHYDPRVEGMHLLFAGIVMAAVSALAVRMGRLRSGLQRRRAELADALERIRVLASHDELTGLVNRREARQRMHDMLAGERGLATLPAVRAVPAGQPAAAGERSAARGTLGVALLDIDHFKRINDALGHGPGDEVLRRFARTCSAHLRAGDLLARWGGEEFLLMMPGTDADAALVVAARLAAAMRATCFDDLSPGLVVTFSAGVAECHESDDLEAAIARADAALYEAKHAGRDRARKAATPARCTAPAVLPQTSAPAPATADTAAD